ncbi:MAG: DUF4139 domain-containing protein [Bacteroidia bacterium]|nr:DUF4139 domain-containing protein [Bacteroidia bacterium]
MKMIYLTLCLLVGNTIVAQTNADLRITSKPKDVTLYLSGAQITATASGSLKEGMQSILFTGLPAGIDQNSVQVKSNTNVLIYSVDFQVNYLQPQDNKAYKLLEDSLKIYTAQTDRLQIQVLALTEEITMLQENRSIGGANSGVSVAKLTKMAEFVRTRMNDTGLKKLETEDKVERINERIRLIQQQMNVLRSASATPSGEVLVQLSAPLAGPVNFELSYYTGNCGWSPLYDIRVKEVGAPASITAKANVFQNTGQDWKNVDITLCTGNPSIGNTQPSLYPWTLYLTDPNEIRRPMMKSKALRYEDAPESTGAPSAMDAAGSRSMAENVIVDNSTATNALFRINTPFTILSSGKENFVEIQKYSVPASYSYFSIPKLDRDAFLVAKISDWQNSELLPGDANVYFENNYIGKSWFNTQLTGDTLTLALGRDNQIKIERKLVKDFNEKNLTGSMKKLTRTFEITVKNTRKSEITIELEDQIPLSSNEAISIEVLERSNAVYDAETGKLSWKLKLKPGEHQKLTMSYSVRYPKKFIVSGL